MTPIHELLNRIRWDKRFGARRFEIGFFDRHDGIIHRVAFAELAFPEAGGRTFQFVDETGQRRRVPFHRIREVYRDGRRIWHRQAEAMSREASERRERAFRGGGPPTSGSPVSSPSRFDPLDASSRFRSPSLREAPPGRGGRRRAFVVQPEARPARIAALITTGRLRSN